MTRTAITRGGSEYIPQYLMSIDIEKCIGCGRCFKVCSRGVMTLHGVTEDGDVLRPGTEEYEDAEDEITKRVMALVAPGECIGCGACARVCPSGCQSHAPLD